MTVMMVVRRVKQQRVQHHHNPLMIVPRRRRVCIILSLGIVSWMLVGLYVSWTALDELLLLQQQQEGNNNNNEPLLRPATTNYLRFRPRRPTPQQQQQQHQRKIEESLVPRALIRETAVLSSMDDEVNLSLLKHPPRPNHRFLVYKGLDRLGQGAGNLMQGLLAAHLLGLEFNRTVCVVWDSFWEAFDYADNNNNATTNNNNSELCQGAAQWPIDRSISVWNHLPQQPPIDECIVRETLESNNLTILAFLGNSYLGWPSKEYIPRDFFHRYYKARPVLWNALPYTEFPNVVVHLRYPDPNEPHQEKRGLDEESLQALGNLLPGNTTYLVTNRPDWYQRFHECCNWSYDVNWENRPIQHGALGWIWRSDGTHDQGLVPRTTTYGNHSNHKQEMNSQNMKLWADWYTILNAQRVYHSSSDFSRSAVHWNTECTGYQLHGMKDNDETFHSKNGTTTTRQRVLDFGLAPYDAVLTHIPPLVERRRDPNTIHMDDECIYLRFCRPLTEDYRNRIDSIMASLEMSRQRRRDPQFHVVVDPPRYRRPEQKYTSRTLVGAIIKDLSQAFFGNTNPRHQFHHLDTHL